MILYSQVQQKVVKLLLSIRERRLSLDITQDDLAKRLNISQQAVAKWETGAAAPRTNMLPQLAKILDCTVDELLQNNDDK